MAHDAQKVAQAFRIDNMLLPDFMTLAAGVPQFQTDAASKGSSWNPVVLQRASVVLSFGERLRKIDDDLANTLVLGDLASTFADTPILNVVTNQPLWRFMERNPNYQKQLQKFFGGDVYGTLLPFALRPSRSATNLLMETMRSEPLLWNSVPPSIQNLNSIGGDHAVTIQQHLSPAPLFNASARHPIVIGVHVRFGMDMVNDHYDARTQNSLLDEYIQGVQNSTLLTIRRYLTATALRDGPTATLRKVILFLAADNKEAKVRFNGFFSVLTCRACLLVHVLDIWWSLTPTRLIIVQERARTKLLSLREVSRVVSVPTKHIDRGKDGMVEAGADLLALGSIAHAVVSSKRYFNAPHSYSLQSTFVGLASALMSSHGGSRPIVRALRPQCPVPGVTRSHSIALLEDCEVSAMNL